MKAKGWRYFLVLTLVGCLLSVCACSKPLSPEKPDEGEANVILDCSVEYDEALVTCEQLVRYTNDTGTDLSKIIFHVPPLKYGFSLENVEVDGMPANNIVVGIVLEVLHPLPADQTAEIKLDFSVALPEYSYMQRTSSTAEVLILGNWFPTLAVWEGDDWNKHKWSYIGDPFFTECANYLVKLTLDEPLTVASTGELVAHEGSTWEFWAENSRNFALAIGPFEAQTTKLDKTVVTVYFLPDSDKVAHANATFIQQKVVEKFHEMEAKVGPYAYDSLDIAVIPTFGVRESWGMSYPTLIILYGMEDLHQKDIAAAAYHETAQEWFGAAIGNNQIDEAWLGEALAAFFSESFGYVILPGIDQNVLKFEDREEYTVVVCRGGALFIAALRDLMGDEAFYTGLWDYYAQYKFKIASGRDFFTVMQSHSPKDLTPLIEEYFTKVYLE